MTGVLELTGTGTCELALTGAVLSEETCELGTVAELDETAATDELGATLELGTGELDTTTLELGAGELDTTTLVLEAGVEAGVLDDST